jgi:hypothetical protein
LGRCGKKKPNPTIIETLYGDKMKVYIDHNKIRKRAELSNLGSIGGLILLLASVLLPLFLPKAASISFVLMVAGLGIAMVGIYYANRWVRKPRPEERLDNSLKGLADSYHLYHYPALPTDHMLLTPNGVVLIETISLAGSFSYKGGRWREAMTIGRALRSIVEEHVGDPIRTALRSEQVLQEQLAKVVERMIPIKALVVFVHPNAELDIEKPSIPVVMAERLKKQVGMDAPRLEQEIYERVDEYLQKITLNK